MSHVTVSVTGLPDGLVLIEFEGGRLCHLVVTNEHAMFIARAIKRATREQAQWIAGVHDLHTDPAAMGPVQPR